METANLDNQQQDAWTQLRCQWGARLELLNDLIVDNPGENLYL